MRALAVVLLSAALMALVPAAASAAEPARCSALKGRDLLPKSKEIRLVRERYTRTDARTDRRYARSRYRICATPDGVVRTAADVGEGAGRRTALSLGITKGTRVVLNVAGSGGASGTYDLTWSLYDARGGRSTPFWRFDSEADVNPLPQPSQVVIEPAGRFGVLYRSDEGPGVWPGIPAGADTLVAGFGRDGVRHDLDAGTRTEIGPRALRLAGSILVWFHGEERRQQDLATLG